MTTLYTIDDQGEIIGGLTAVEAADILLTNDSYEYEVRRDEKTGDWLLFISPYSRASTLGGRPMVRAADMYSFAADEATATAEIMERVIRSGRWEKGELQCRTDEQHAEMMAALAADEAGC